MLTDLAEKMGVKQAFTEGRTQEEWLRHIYQQSRENLPELPTFEEFRQQGIFKKSIQMAFMWLIRLSVKIRKRILSKHHPVKLRFTLSA